MLLSLTSKTALLFYSSQTRVPKIIMHMTLFPHYKVFTFIGRKWDNFMHSPSETPTALPYRKIILRSCVPAIYALDWFIWFVWFSPASLRVHLKKHNGHLITWLCEKVLEVAAGLTASLLQAALPLLLHLNRLVLTLFLSKHHQPHVVTFFSYLALCWHISAYVVL